MEWRKKIRRIYKKKEMKSKNKLRLTCGLKSTFNPADPSLMTADSCHWLTPVSDFVAANLPVMVDTNPYGSNDNNGNKPQTSKTTTLIEFVRSCPSNLDANGFLLTLDVAGPLAEVTR
jgi:hypothetical protein